MQHPRGQQSAASRTVNVSAAPSMKPGAWTSQLARIINPSSKWVGCMGVHLQREVSDSSGEIVERFTGRTNFGSVAFLVRD